MIVEVVTYPGGELVKVDVGSKDVVPVAVVLRRLGYRPYEVVVTVNGELVTEDDVVRDGDLVEVYKVMSVG